MFEKLFMKRILFSLTQLFIWIRSNPENRNFLYVLSIYEKYFTKEMQYNYKTIRNIKKEIAMIQNFEGKKSILDELEGFFLTIQLKNKQYIYISTEIFNYIFKEMIKRIEKEEYDKLRTMASSVHNLPKFLLGNENINPEVFFKEDILFYNKVWNEDFMCIYKDVFEKNFK